MYRTLMASLALLAAGLATWAQEEKELGPGDFNYCRYGGYLGTKAMKTTHRRLYAVHSGKEPPVSQKARTQ